MDTSCLIKNPEIHHLQQMVLVKLAGSMYKNLNRSILTTLHKTKLQMDQRPKQKPRYTEPERREIEGLLMGNVRAVCNSIN